jgi:hypothetical protein
MTTHASPQCAKPEVSPASSPEEHELPRDAAAPSEGDKQEQKNVADNQAPDQSPDIDSDEYGRQRRRFDSPGRLGRRRTPAAMVLPHQSPLAAWLRR